MRKDERAPKSPHGAITNLVRPWALAFYKKNNRKPTAPEVIDAHPHLKDRKSAVERVLERTKPQQWEAGPAELPEIPKNLAPEREFDPAKSSTLQHLEHTIIETNYLIDVVMQNAQDSRVVDANSYDKLVRLRKQAKDWIKEEEAAAKGEVPEQQLQTMEQIKKRAEARKRARKRKAG